MDDPSPLRCYLVEWYSPRLTDEPFDRAVAELDECAASMCVEGRPVQLLLTLAIPTDEVVFGIFGAESAEMVAQTCQRAGHPAVRLTAAVDVTGRALAAVGTPITREP